MLLMSAKRHETSGWRPPVIETVAVEERGIDELYQAILNHRSFLLEDGPDRLKRRQESRVRRQLMDLLKEGLLEGALEKIGGMEGINVIVEEIVTKKKDPYRMSSDLVQKLLGGAPC